MRSLLPFSLYLLLCITLIACSATEEASLKSSAPSGVPANESSQERALVRSAYSHVEVTDLQASVSKAEKIAKNFGGYVMNSSLKESDSARMSLRVEAEKLEEVLDALAGLGSEVSRKVSSEDVSEHLVDLGAKLDNSLKLRERLRNLLEKATRFEDILSIERELTRLQSEIDVLEGQMKTLKSKVALALIDVEFEEHKILGPLGYVFKGTFWLLGKLFILN